MVGNQKIELDHQRKLRESFLVIRKTKMLRKGEGLTKTERLLVECADYYENEDRFARDRQILLCRKLKLFWDNFQQVWYSEVAHDWRINVPIENDDQSYYDKPINIFRAYLESVIAALSVTVPPLTCYPDDADNELDLSTAKAGNKIAQLIYRHNDVPLLWVHALYIYMTEGMISCYNYPVSTEKFGTYTEQSYNTRLEEVETLTCPNCGYTFEEKPKSVATPEIVMEEEGITIPGQEAMPLESQGMEEECPSCGSVVIPQAGTDSYEIDEMVKTSVKNKTRQCLEVYGGLYVKIPIAAKKPEDIFYCIFNCEVHESVARAQYPDIRDRIQAGVTSNDVYGRWGRMSSQYAMSEAENLVTKRRIWLEPAAFECLNKEDAMHLKKKFPRGAHVCIVNEELAEYNEEALDEHWTFTHNPLADYMQHDPIGMMLTSIQELTNDLISLIIQTVEHGIPQTFADPSVLNFNKYKQSEAGPGFIYPANPKSGKPMNESFYEVKTATLSPEIFPFAEYLQALGQTVSGALPSLFGGQMEGSRTASEYSMSRNQALQRLQNIWKMMTIWWKQIFNKAIVHYIQGIKDDEKYVEKDQAGNFVNVLITKAELEGHIGSVELEANENLPLTWIQRKDVIIQLMGTQNQQVLQALASPENLPIMQEALGLSDFYLPGEDDRAKQYDEIKRLLESEPIMQPPSEEETLQAISMGLPPPEEQELPAVEVDQFIDNHQIQFEICRKWLVSDAGRLAKIENEMGYRNVMLHALQHNFFLQPPPMAAGPQQGGTDESATRGAPVTGEPNVVA